MLKVVNAISAESGGALTNLSEMYKEAVENREIQWVFITGKIKLQPKENIKVLSYPEVKKSWFHRLAFDVCRSNRIINSFQPDVVYNFDFYRRSKRTCGDYYFFATNVLYYTDIVFSIKDSKELWLRQKLLKPLAFYSIRHSDYVVIESEWLRHRITAKTGFDSNRIIVKPHKVVITPANEVEIGQAANFFFYPTSGYIYKNTKAIILSALELAKEGLFPSIVLTLRGDETTEIVALKQQSEKNGLSICWIGNLDCKQMGRAYQKCVLLFPSYLETVGLPLLEAKSFNRKIICADQEYAHSALNGYPNVSYFNYANTAELASLMRYAINNEMKPYEGNLVQYIKGEYNESAGKRFNERI